MSINTLGKNVSISNKKIRSALSEANIPQWKLAELMGISEFTLSRKLRHELPETEQKRIADLIAKSVKESR